MSLETIVRPFQLPSYAKNVRVEQTGQREVRRVVLEIGKGGSPKVMNGSESQTVTYYCDRYLVEKSSA